MIFFLPSDGIQNSTNRNVPCLCSANEKPRGYYDTGECGSTEGRLSEHYIKFSSKCFVFHRAQQRYERSERRHEKESFPPAPSRWPLGILLICFGEFVAGD